MSFDVMPSVNQINVNIQLEKLRRVVVDVCIPPGARFGVTSSDPIASTPTMLPVNPNNKN